MKASFVLSSLLLATSALAAPSPEARAKRQQGGFVPITGVTGNGQQARVELRTMQQQNPTMYALYLLGLQEFKAMPQTDKLSFYQIAGIHGRPYLPWDNNPYGPDGNGYGGGYCTHVSNIFLPWHRPYLALYEQQLYAHVQNVAKKYSTNAQTIAKNFRIPYWDWAAAPCANVCSYMPKLITDQYAIITIDGKQQSIENPHFRYKFTDTPQQRIKDQAFTPFAQWQYSKRYPTMSKNGSYLAPYGVSQNNLINAKMQTEAAGLRSRVYNLLTNYNNFTQFSNEAWLQGGGSSGNTDSLESVHDSIHYLVGGDGGSMTYLDYSAFDPAFWLHHANVDRLFALWQALRPNSAYVQPMASIYSNFYYQEGDVQSANSYLAPFHSSASGAQWTSARARSVNNFGYTYPELISGKSLISQINALYNTGGTSSSAKKAKKARRDASGSTVSTTLDRQYVANIVSQKFELSGSYRVHIFIGEVPDDMSTWQLPDSNLVGTQYVLANLNASANADMKVTGSIPLTNALSALIDSGDLESMDPDDVEPYLENNLSWRVVKAGEIEVPVRDLTDLSVTVATATYTPPATNNDLPSWGAWESLANVTSGQPGGHDEAYWNLPAHKMGKKFTFSNLVKPNSGKTGRS